MIILVSPVEGRTLFLLWLRAGKEAASVIGTLLEDRPQNTPLTVRLTEWELLIGPLKYRKYFGVNIGEVVMLFLIHFISKGYCIHHTHPIYYLTCLQYDWKYMKNI